MDYIFSSSFQYTAKLSHTESPCVPCHLHRPLPLSASHAGLGTVNAEEPVLVHIVTGPCHSHTFSVFFKVNVDCVFAKLRILC